LSEENIKIKISALLNELQKITSVSDEEINEFKEILDLDDFSQVK
tara:strand:+ start:555 stop:689 length:135 start_codon:yes stop_codon:yes gene_type:complete